MRYEGTPAQSHSADQRSHKESNGDFSTLRRLGERPAINTDDRQLPFRLSERILQRSDTYGYLQSRLHELFPRNVFGDTLRERMSDNASHTRSGILGRLCKHRKVDLRLVGKSASAEREGDVPIYANILDVKRAGRKLDGSPVSGRCLIQ